MDKDLESLILWIRWDPESHLLQYPEKGCEFTVPSGFQASA